MDKERLLDLTNKLYHLTLLFPKKEPLRYKLREVAIEFLAKCLNSRIRTLPKEEIALIDSFLKIVENQNWVQKEKIEEIREGYLKFIEEFKQALPNFNLNSRQEKILEILKERKKLQIWQLKEYFPEVSKRTLRRDLVKLVQAGFVLRTGEVSNTFYQVKNE